MVNGVLEQRAAKTPAAPGAAPSLSKRVRISSRVPAPNQTGDRGVLEQQARNTPARTPTASFLTLFCKEGVAPQSREFPIILDKETNFMDFNSLALSRRSVRAFNKTVIDDDTVREILVAARAAPSAGNCQAWHFVVIRDEKVIAEICDKAVSQSFIMTAPMAIVVCADIKRITPRYGERGKHLYCIQDTAAAIMNMLLCAQSRNIGSCWIGAFDENALSGLLNLDKDMRPVAVLPFGYHDNPPAPQRRRPLEEIATFIGGASVF